MNTLEIEIAIMKACNIRQNIVVPNVSFGMVRYFHENGQRKYDELHECDILKVTPSGYATEYEIKISKADFKNDFKKKHTHNSRFIKQLYYVVPFELLEFAKENYPPRSGLAYVRNEKLHYHTRAPIRIGAFKWTDKEISQLSRLGTLRILGLKKKIDKIQRTIPVK